MVHLCRIGHGIVWLILFYLLWITYKCDGDDDGGDDGDEIDDAKWDSLKKIHKLFIYKYVKYVKHREYSNPVNSI